MRVLVVDDSHLSRIMLTKIVAETIPNAVIFKAGSSDEALALTKALDHVDIAIFDFNMQGITGLELFDRFEGSLDISKRILLSSNVQDSVRSKAEANGIIFCSKPIDEEMIRPLLMAESVMEPLHKLELDALKELFNIGSERSAKALSSMVSQPVELTIPEVQIIQSHTAAENLKMQNTGLISAVSQRFSGDFNGHALLMFNQESGLVLVRKLLQDSVPLDDLTELEQDSLLEVGNIMLNSCFGTVINNLHSEIEVDLPHFEQGTISEIYSHIAEKDWSLYVALQISLPHEDIVGHISFVMDIHSLQKFQAAVADYMLGANQVAAR